MPSGIARTATGAATDATEASVKPNGNASVRTGAAAAAVVGEPGAEVTGVGVRVMPSTKVATMPIVHRPGRAITRRRGDVRRLIIGDVLSVSPPAAQRSGVTRASRRVRSSAATAVAECQAG